MQRATTRFTTRHTHTHTKKKKNELTARAILTNTGRI
jgi:hypothetical protein